MLYRLAGRSGTAMDAAFITTPNLKGLRGVLPARGAASRMSGRLGGMDEFADTYGPEANAGLSFDWTTETSDYIDAPAPAPAPDFPTGIGMPSPTTGGNSWTQWLQTGVQAAKDVANAARSAQGLPPQNAIVPPKPAAQASFIPGVSNKTLLYIGLGFLAWKSFGGSRRRR